MPLSEQEQLILWQIQERLRRDDPRLAGLLGGGGAAQSRRHDATLPARRAAGLLAAGAGVCALVSGAALDATTLGVAGWCLMVSGAWQLLRPGR